jgi:hypothetical protein
VVLGTASLSLTKSRTFTGEPRGLWTREGAQITLRFLFHPQASSVGYKGDSLPYLPAMSSSSCRLKQIRSRYSEAAILREVPRPWLTTAAKTAAMPPRYGLR